MADFFQPGDASQTSTATPSPAAQAEAQFRTIMLGKILDSLAGHPPSFASFAKGGPATREFPGGFGPDIANLLSAMREPGAFTSTQTGSLQPPTPSILSDITQLGVLGAMLAKALGISPLAALGKILQPLGGLLGIGQTTPPAGGASQPLGLFDVPSIFAGTEGGFSPETSLDQILYGANLPEGYGVLQSEYLQPQSEWSWTY